MANQVHGIRLTALGYTQLRTSSHAEFDLLDQAAVNRFFADQRIDQVYLSAARVGGIHANNTYSADFIYQNAMIEANLIQAAHRHGVQRPGAVSVAAMRNMSAGGG